MAQHLVDGGKLLLQLHDEFRHRFLLLLGAGVGYLSLLVESSLVADADAVGIVPLGMCAHSLQRSGGLHSATSGDVEVVADVAPVVHLYMVVKELLHWVRLVAAGSAAVNHNQCNQSSHNLAF